MKKEKACGCIIIENKKVLLIKQNNNLWGFPKGHVEGNETEYETALREVKEETNIEVQIIDDKRYTIKYVTDNGRDKEVVFFIAKPITAEIKPQEEEISDIEWLDFKEAMEKITYNNTKELFERVLKDMKVM